MDGKTGLRVMIVENEYAMLEVLRDYFSMQEGIVCCDAASTGQEALNRIYSLLPDVVLLDLVMPGPDGLSVLEQLQANPPERRPRIIVISSFGGDRIVRETLRLGADYYMIKPFALDDLLSRVRMLGLQDRSQVVAESPLRVRIDLFLSDLGSDRRKLGHLYIVETVEQMIEGGPGQYLNAIFKDVAERHCTSESGVAEAVRRAMAVIHRRQSPLYRSLQLEENHGKPPSPGRFLVAFAARVQPVACKTKGGVV